MKMKIQKKCKHCGNDYFVDSYFADTSKFCSRECYRLDKKENAITLKPKVCPTCGKDFYSQHTPQVFCSKICRGKADRNRKLLECEYCGKEFERIESEVIKNKHHYCSKFCKYMAVKWSESDIKIVKENYRKIPNKDILPLLSKKYSEKALRSEAGRLGLYQSRSWNETDIQILIENYSTKPFNEVQLLLPDKTMCSILGKAKSLGVKSWFYLNSIYTDDEELYIRDNYMFKTNEEMALHLNRTPSGISQHMIQMGIERKNITSREEGYRSLAKYVRGKIECWKQSLLESENYTCCISGDTVNITTHHIISFGLLLDEAIEMIDFKIKHYIQDYNDDELEKLLIYFMDLQEYYGAYCCVREDIHRLFHKLYGYGSNTVEQWNEFVERYKNGKYNVV